jgi:ribosome-associated protein
LTEIDEENSGAPLCLDQFLKLSGVAGTGGQAKLLIQGGEVQVNGEVETRRRKKLSPEDVVEVAGESMRVGDFLSPS